MGELARGWYGSMLFVKIFSVMMFLNYGCNDVLHLTLDTIILDKLL